MRICYSVCPYIIFRNILQKRLPLIIVVSTQISRGVPIKWETKRNQRKRSETKWNETNNRIIFFILFLYFVLSFIFFLPFSSYQSISLVSFHFVSLRFRWFRFVSHFIGTPLLICVLTTIILINYNPSCMSVRYSTLHVHYPQLNPSRVCLPTNFQKFKCHIFICVWVCVSIYEL
jgi:hypothetical protein